jgi:hypothetical protein
MDLLNLVLLEYFKFEAPTILWQIIFVIEQVFFEVIGFKVVISLLQRQATIFVQ